MPNPGNTRPTADHHPLRVMIIAGDPSGDIHTAHVVRALRGLHPKCEIFGVGGDKMIAEGFESLVPMDKMAVMGFFEVLRHMRFFAEVNRRLLTVIEERKPQVIVLVDYPGFNIRFAQRIRKRFPDGETYRPKLLYYISPQVWAWKPGRIKILAAVMDFMSVVFPFEAELYQKAGLPVEFVGHPLLDQPEPRDKEALFREAGLRENDDPIALLPGSRLQEVERHLPIFVSAFDMIQKKHPELFALVAASDHVPPSAFQRYQMSNRRLKVLCGWTREIMSHSQAAMVKSGTATLETALFGTPSVIAYRANPLTFWIAKRVVTVPYIGMVNILAGESVVTELIQSRVTPERLAQEMEKLLYDQNRRVLMIEKLQRIRDRLGQPGSGRRVADKIIELANAH